MKLRLTYQQAATLFHIFNSKAKFNALDTAARRHVLRIIRALRHVVNEWQEFVKMTNDKFPDKAEAVPVIEAEFVTTVDVDAEPLDVTAIDALIESNPDWDIATAEFVDETLAAPAPEPEAKTGE